MRIGYLECFSGMSGDMLLGALVDAGVDLALLKDTTARLNVGARLEARKVTRGGISATKLDVIAPAEHVDRAHHDAPAEHAHAHTHEGHSHPHEHEQPAQRAHSHAHHRSLSAILKIIGDADLSNAVKTRSMRAFELLGAAEAAIHAVPVESVHFHEVGAVDTIVDIVCSAAGCESLGIDRWVASPLNVGSGTVVCAHGTLPVPAPATLALLGDAPVYSAGLPMERVTPTGAAILQMLNVHYSPLPAMRVKASGYGAGSRETPGEPNLLRMLIGEAGGTAADIQAQSPQSIAIVESVIDDSSPQLLGYVSELLLAAGAWDVYRAAVQMKKGRTGVQLTVLCDPGHVNTLRDIIFRETTTIGLHWRIEHKSALAREFCTIQTQWGDVEIKVARLPSGEIANASPEYEHCRAIAERQGVPLKQVMQEAMRVYSSGAVEREAF